MSTPPGDGSEVREPLSFEKPAATPADPPTDDPPFDPYRYGAPEHPVPPEYAPPGYVPPVQQAAPTQTPTQSPVPGYPPQQPAGYPPYGGGYPPYPGYPGPPAYPPPPWSSYPQPRTGNGRAIAALVLGIGSIVFFWTSIFDVVPVVLAIIFGSIAINDARRGSTGRNMAITGIVCGVIGALLAITFTVVVYARIKPCLDNYDQGSSAQNTCIRHKF